MKVTRCVLMSDPHLELPLGLTDPACVFGGPARKAPTDTRRLKLVKMAEEIDAPHDISIPTRDFSVPPTVAMERGVAQAISAMMDGNDLYVFCMGGVGRTGLFMCCLVRAIWDRSDLEYDESAPITYVRKHYNLHAVETPAQRKYVADFDTEAVWELLSDQPWMPTKEPKLMSFFEYLRLRFLAWRDRREA